MYSRYYSSLGWVVNTNFLPFYKLLLHFCYAETVCHRQAGKYIFTYACAYGSQMLTSNIFTYSSPTYFWDQTLTNLELPFYLADTWDPFVSNAPPDICILLLPDFTWVLGSNLGSYACRVNSSYTKPSHQPIETHEISFVNSYFLHFLLVFRKPLYLPMS